MKSALTRFLPLICFVAAATLAQSKKPIEVTWLGHAAFEVVSPGGTHILIDPFLKQNPKTPDTFKDLSRYKPKLILVTHSHFDHSGDALEIAQQSGAAVVSSFDYVSGLNLPDKQKMGGNVGGTFTVDDVSVSLVPAMHSSEPAGRPLGFVIRFSDGRALYHTGDTWIFNDMGLIQDMYHPNILLFNVGGGPFTQDPKTAAIAVKKYFNPDVIVPMHYGTFPVLSTEESVRDAFKGDKRLVVMKPGETKSF